MTNDVKIHRESTERGYRTPNGEALGVDEVGKKYLRRDMRYAVTQYAARSPSSV
jgi:hypothetical protein